MKDDHFFEELADEVLKSIDREAEKLANRVGLIIERETKDVLRQNDKIATAEMYKGIFFKVRKRILSYFVTISSNADYSVYVYDGTKPHFPPLNKIVKWVRIKRMAGRYSIKTKRRMGKKQDKLDEDKALAWAIAVSISRKGTKGFKFFDLALKQALPILEEEVQSFGYSIE